MQSRIMTAWENGSEQQSELGRKVSIGSRNIINLPFANDTAAVAEEEQELEAQVESLAKVCTRHKMEISVLKTKQMANSANGIQREIKVKVQRLGTITVFKCLSSCFR